MSDAIAAPQAPTPPKPSPSPPPTKPPAPATTAPTPAAETDTFEALDRALNPKRKDDPKVEGPRGDEEDGDEGEDGETEAPQDKVEEATPPRPKEERTIDTPKSRRAKLEQALSETKAARDALAEREAKIAEYEGRSKETTTLAERLAAVEKERDEARAEARGLRQEVSPEFLAKYDAPFNREANEAQRFFEQLTVQSEDGTTRKASWENDFALLYRMPEVEAADRAEVMFGKHAQRVMARYDRLHTLENMKETARMEERANWQKTETERTANALKERETATAMYAHVEKDLKERHADWFADKPDEAEESALVKSHSAKLTERPKTMQEHVVKQARIKLYAENFPRIVYRLNKAIERISELEAKDASASDSEPGKTRRTASVNSPSADTFEEGLLKLGRR